MDKTFLYRILVVDDEPHILKVIELYLEQLDFKYEVKTCEDGKDALVTFNTFNPHVCFLDNNLPNLSGTEILKEIKTINPICKVIMISGDISSNNIITALRFGATDYLEKPLSYDVFAETLIKAINQYENLNKSKQYHDFLEERVKHKFSDLASVIFNVIQSLSIITEFKDPYTAGHMERVSYIAKLIGRHLGLTSNEIRYLHIAGLLHDIGKITVPIEILNKPSTLTVNEFNLIKEHSRHGFEIIKNIPFDLIYDYDIKQPVLNHHERLDGSGYPNGLRGSEIDELTRILSISDVIESVSAMRPYRQPLGLDAALQILADGKGNHFDTSIVDSVHILMSKYRTIDDVLNEKLTFHELKDGIY